MLRVVERGTDCILYKPIFSSAMVALKGHLICKILRRKLLCYRLQMGIEATFLWTLNGDRATNVRSLRKKNFMLHIQYYFASASFNKSIFTLNLR